MKFVALVAVILGLSCRDRQPEVAAAGSGAAPSSPASADAAVALDACGIGLRALDVVKCPDEALAQVKRAKQQLAGVVGMMGSGGLGGSEQQQIACAQMVLAFERDAAKLHCTIPIAAGDRAKLVAMLDAFYARRTPVTPTGDGEADAVIARIVAVRDAVCACRDPACLDRVEGRLDAIGTFAATAPQNARDLGAKLLDDIGRC